MKHPLGESMKRIAQLLLALLVSVCSLSLDAQAEGQEDQFDISSFESRAKQYQSGDYLVKTVPVSCGASQCIYRLEIYQGKELLMTLMNSSPFARVISRTCVELLSTNDFQGVADIAMAFGPHLPIVICKTGDRLYDATNDDLAQVYRDQFALLAKFMANPPNFETERHAVVAALLVYEIYLRSDFDLRELCSTDPTWKHVLTSEDQAWLREAKTEIYERLRGRIDNHK